MRDRDALARYYRELREKKGSDDRDRWVLLIKELRVTYNCSNLDAERAALAEPIWRRWVEHHINQDSRCAKMARLHIRINGDAALIVEKDGKLAVR